MLNVLILIIILWSCRKVVRKLDTDIQFGARVSNLTLNATGKKKGIRTEYKATGAKCKQLVGLGRISVLFFSPSLKLYKNCYVFRMFAVHSDRCARLIGEPDRPGFCHLPAELDTCTWHKHTQTRVWNTLLTSSFSHSRTGTSLAQHPTTTHSWTQSQILT